MKVLHIDSGLGNQMLAYCEYLAIRKVHPEETCYIENLIYEVPEASEAISQWNGYELDKIFGLKAPNIKELFEDTAWQRILDSIKKSRFWEKDWNWPIYFNEAFEKEGLKLLSLRGDFEVNKNLANNSRKYRIKHWKIYVFAQKSAVFELGRQCYKRLKKYKTSTDIANLYYAGKEDFYTGMRLTFMLRNNMIERIEKEIEESFRFPPIVDPKNQEAANTIKKVEAVAIHVRRGDMMHLGERYFKSGYFKRAVGYIKKKVNSPEFFVFCDPGSVEWCKENYTQLGLDKNRDSIHFVDWNSGDTSFRDLQLMCMCKHNIITNSSFGWWGTYLNKNPNKITISSEIEINTTHHF